MSEYDYLIIGGGMTGRAAASGIREYQPAASIGLIGDEGHRPYKRPPLSKALWRGEPEASVWLDPVPGVELLLGRIAVFIDRGRKRVVDDLGKAHGYRKLLLATGARPRRLGAGDDGVIYFRSLDDFCTLRALAAGSHVGVVGGGFIGTELAAALVTNQMKVTLFFPEANVGARLFPSGLAEYLTGYYRQRGVDVRPGVRVTGVDRGRRVLFDGGGLDVDAVVAGLGTVANDGLARAAGLAVDDGILVDEGLRTDDPDIFAAGDGARFANELLGARLRVEHEDNALTMGRLAGAAMTGQPVSYRHLPFFYSDLFDLGYEAIGDVDARLEVVADWKTENREGCLYYLQNGRVRGVVTWGIFGQMDQARALIAEPGPHDPASLVGRLPRVS
ncbi:MAG: FAD-dependent oxidoreductase [Deltaproteobacteria bacterium]|nr:FAD-dependent oxidoreductase [Deltaproteobacteria bacterium]